MQVVRLRRWSVSAFCTMSIYRSFLTQSLSVRSKFCCLIPNSDLKLSFEEDRDEKHEKNASSFGRLPGFKTKRTFLQFLLIFCHIHSVATCLHYRTLRKSILSFCCLIAQWTNQSQSNNFPCGSTDWLLLTETACRLRTEF